MLESDVLRQVEGRYELFGPLSTLAIPSTLQDSLMARLDQNPVIKEVAQLGAVLGREFAYATLKALTPLDDARLPGAALAVDGKKDLFLSFNDCIVSHMTRNSVVANKEELVRDFRIRGILEAACRVVAQHGFQGATIDRVAEEAGIAKGTVYLYFHTKEELLKAAVEQGMENFTSQIRAEVEEITEPLEKLCRLVEASMELSDAQRDFFKMLLLERNFLAAAPTHPEAAQMLDLYLAYIHLIASVIQEGVEAGVLRPHDVEISAFALNEAMRGCFQQRALGLTSRTAADEAVILLDLFFHGILNPRYKEQLS